MTSRLCLIGLNHRTAPLEIRERVAVTAAGLGQVLTGLRSDHQLDEVVLLSTCNRTEIYAVGDPETTQNSAGWLDNLGGGPLTGHTYTRNDLDAARHLFRVAAGLDSMVLGESEVLGQVKGAYGGARAAGTAGPVMHALFQGALRAGSRARTETDIGVSAVSVPSVALGLAHKVFADLGGKRALLIGTGDAGRVALKHLVEAGLSEIVAANRTPARAEAALQALDLRSGASRPVATRAMSIQDVPVMLPLVDIVLACSEAPYYVITPGDVPRATGSRRGRSLLLIDLGVPRQIDPAVAGCEGAYLFNIDDLETVVQTNLAERRREAAKVEDIVSQEVAVFDGWRRGRKAVPVIRRFRAQAEAIRAEEVERLLEALGQVSPHDRELLIAFSRRITNRILDYPTVTLRELAAEREGHAAIELLNRLLRSGLRARRPRDPAAATEGGGKG